MGFPNEAQAKKLRELMEDLERRSRYFLAPADTEDWQEVTQERFVAAERAAGFIPKPGLGPVATGGFSSTAAKFKGKVEIVDADAAPPIRKFYVVAATSRWMTGFVAEKREETGLLLKPGEDYLWVHPSNETRLPADLKGKEIEWIVGEGATVRQIQQQDMMKARVV